MERFSTNDAIAQWETELPVLSGDARLDALTRLSWHLRQRDTRRAVVLANQADALLAQSSLPGPRRQGILARLLLVHGEAKWLYAEMAEAETLANDALRKLTEIEDAAGVADAHWLLAFIAADMGNATLRDAELEASAEWSRQAGDALRAGLAEAALARTAILRNPREAQARWGKGLGAVTNETPLSLATWVNDYLGSVAFQSSDFGRAVTHFIRTQETALATGQVRRAITAATNAGNAFTSLNDHHSALEWMQRGLDLARRTAWPSSVGGCLMQAAETLRQLGRLDSAQEMLQEALVALAPLANSHSYGIALAYLGELALDRGDFSGAIEIFHELEERAVTLKQSDFQSTVRRGEAYALSHLGRPDEALAAAMEALALTREQHDAYNQIAVLKVLAAIHARHALPAPGEMTLGSAPLHYLSQALEVAATIDGYIVPGDLLEAIGHEYARAGDHAKAYEIALRAGAAREKIHGQDATNRAIAMQVRHETDRARAEGEHLRQLAASEAKRAEVLQQTSATLESLGAIGQEITAHLESSAVFRTLDRHVHQLLDATSFAIFLMDADGQGLTSAFCVEAGQPLPVGRVALSSPTSITAACARERREIVIDSNSDADKPKPTPGTIQVLSALFAPLTIGNRVLGVMTIQSPRAHAYTERERLIFRNLCAYGAIALDNAAAYRQLEATLKTLSDTQAELLEKNLELELTYRELEEVSLTDPLTGLNNRRYLLQHMEADVAMSLRHYEEWLKQPANPLPAHADLVFFLVDLDHFKAVNDIHGHASGDLVLVEMRQRLREVFRESDYLIRWGGEEFLVVARATDRDEAEVLAERLLQAVSERPFELQKGIRIAKTCSVGFACFPFLRDNPRLLSWTQVVELADLGLYRAKHAGRNAWVGLHGTERSRPDDLFQRLLLQAEQALRNGELRLACSSKKHET